MDGSLLGVASVTAAATLSLVKIVEKLLDKKHPQNGNGNAARYVSRCEAESVGDRLQEYHTENRQLLKEIRDGIRDLIAMQRVRD